MIWSESSEVKTESGERTAGGVKLNMGFLSVVVVDETLLIYAYVSILPFGVFRSKYSFRASHCKFIISDDAEVE